MERKLSVLIIEDEQTECDAIIRYVDTTDDVFLVGVTNNANKALIYVKECLPDVIILDLELHKGSGNGLTFLKALRELNLRVFPYVLITTNNTSPVTYEQARRLGADFIMAKYQYDYSAKNVIEFLRSIKSTLYNNARMHGLPADLATTEPLDQLSKRVLNGINKELNLIGISPKAVGKRYLMDAIQTIINGPERNISAIVGKKHGKSDASVERAMQNAINAAWRSSDISDLRKYYTARINSDKGVPTIMEFIYFYADKVKNEYI